MGKTRSVRTREFRKLYNKLPAYVRAKARRDFIAWRNEGHPIHGWLSEINRLPGLYSKEIGDNWRALARIEGDVFVWEWIGSHEDYNNELRRRKR